MINIPKLKELYDGIISDIQSEFNITIPSFGKSFLRALASVEAGKLKMYYLLTGKVQKNVFPDTADSELQGGTLERFGRVKLGRNPFPSTQGEYTIQLTGTTGALVKASTTFKSDDSSSNPGKLFVLDNNFTLNGTNIITVRSLEAGTSAKLSVNDTLTLTAPISLVNDSAIVLTEVTAPVDEEEIEDYRRKILDSFRLEPEGGAASDYRIWASEVTGVQQSYPYTSNNANEINLFIEATISSSVDGKGTPSSTILSDVEDNIELPTLDRPSRKPLTVSNINYLPVTPKDIDIQILGYVNLDIDKENLILSSIQDLIDSIRPFVASIDVINSKNNILDNNNVISAILTAVPGSIFTSVNINIDSSLYSNYEFVNGDIPYLNSVNYI